MSAVRLSALCVLLISVISPTFAWWDTGHMLVAQIALKYLANETFTNSSVSATSITAVQNAIDAINTYSPATSDIVTSACWMDDIKMRNLTQFNGWHYLNVPFCLYNDTTVCQALNLPTPYQTITAEAADNVVWAIQSAIRTVQGNTALGFERGFALRNLLHLVGDIHQPLHCADGYFEQCPNGDLGGNLFLLNNVSWASNLHSFWDGGAGMYFTTFPRPLDAQAAGYISQQADWIMSQIVITPGITDNLNITEWAIETADLAQTYAYDLPYNSTPSAEYTATAQKVIVQQLGTAGYRLSLLLASMAQCNDTAGNCPMAAAPGPAGSFNKTPYIVAIAVLATFLGVVSFFLLAVLYNLDKKERKNASTEHASLLTTPKH